MLETLLDHAAELEFRLAAFVHSRPAHRPEDWHRAYWMLQFLDEIRPHPFACQYTQHQSKKLIRELEFWCNCAAPFAKSLRLPLSRKVTV